MQRQRTAAQKTHSPAVAVAEQDTKKLYRYSAIEQAALIRSGQVSSQELVWAHLQRIEAINPTINAVTVVLKESALKQAELADSAQAQGPLHGVPFTVKESIDCLGSATTLGVRALENALPHLDAPVVSRLKAAGAIPIARTNMSELGMRVCTSNPLRGVTLNPFAPQLTVGGSSGGDAAALATGMTPLGLGSDFGGSLRSPAYCCGIASLKPTTGRIPHAVSSQPQDFGAATQLMQVEGPMARSVADLRLALSLLAGRDIRDPRSVDAPLQGAPLQEEPPCAALVAQIPGVDLPPATIAAVKRSGELLAQAGWEVEEAVPPELMRVNEVWGQLAVVDLAVMASMLQPIMTVSLHDYLQRMCNLMDYTKTSNLAIHAERSRLIRLWSGFLSCYQVVVGPTWCQLPWPLDADLNEQTGLEMLGKATRFITPANVLGLPAVAVPSGMADGLPTGVQVYADLWREDLCLAAAEIIEAGVGRRWPIE